MRHTSRIRSFAWYGTVILLVLLAVTVSLARVIIGSASEYRVRVEEMAGQYLGQPVTINNMDARLLGIKPTLLFKDVSLRETSSLERLAHFDQIGIALNPLSSLRHLQPVIDLTIHGANIVIIQQENGGFRLQGVTLSEKAKSSQGGGDLGAWFLSQSRLALENSRIIWRNDKTGRDTIFEGVSVELQNMTERHRLNASVQLPENIGKTLRLALDIRGNLLNQNDWVGELYIKAAQVKPSQWIKDVEYQGLSFERGDINLEMWSNWRNGLLESVEGEFNLADLKIKRKSKTLPVNRLSGQWRYRTGDEGWQLLMQNAVIRNGDEQTTPFQLQLQELNGLASVRAENLDIDRLMNFSPYLPGLNGARHKQLQQMMPGGWVDTLRVDLLDGELLGAVASVKEFHMAPWEKLPGVSGLTARLGFDGKNGSVELDSRDLVLTLPTLFENTLPLQQTRGLVRVARLGKGWRVRSDNLEIDSDDLHMQLGMSLQLQPGESPLMSLVGDFRDGRARSVPTYLPVKIMPKGSVQWLKSAFLGGLVTRGSVILHGKMEKSLLEKKQGRFEVRFDANDVTLNFMEDWPRLDAVRGEALFTGPGMEINIEEGRIYGSRIGKTVVGIADFKHSLLSIDGSVKASAQDALRFLREAPFSRDMGLQSFAGQGNTPIQLSLSIPLSAETAKKSPLSIKGSVALQGNHFQFAKGVLLSKVKGQLNFTEKTFSADEITAMMYGFPATLTIFSEGSKFDQRGATVVAVRGHATAKSVRKALDLKLLEIASGESDWQARMTLTPGDEGGVVLDIFSDLKGVAINLPQPMGKGPEIERSLAITLGLGGKQRGINSLQYNAHFNTVWQAEPDNGKILRSGVVLGKDEVAQLPEQEVLQIGGVMDDLHWLEWRKVINHYFPEQPGEEKMPLAIRMQRLHVAKMEGEPEKSSALPLMPTIDIDIHDFAYDGMQFGGIAGRIEPSPNLVHFKSLKVNSKDFKLEGSGSWRPGGKTRMTLKLNSGNLGKMFRGMGFASVIDGGKTKAHGKLEWPGSPLDFSLKGMMAKGHVNIEEGVISQIDPGAGKLLGLLSLEALPRRLFLDFSDMSGKGLEFTTIKGDLRIRDGDALTDNLVLKSLPADILVTGRTGLVARDFDQKVSVVPNVAGTVSVAGALAWGPQVAAVLAIVQGLFKSGIDEATMTRYEIHGTWEKPQIIRLEPEPLPEEENKIPGVE